MQILLIVLSVIVGLVALVLILALFAKKEYQIHRRIAIQKPKHEVYEYLRHIKNQDHFNKWVMVDPGMKKEYRGTDGTVGFVYAWDSSKKAGKGEQEITALRQNERIDMEIRFERPFKGLSITYMNIAPQSSILTEVTWVVGSKMSYPMNIITLFMNMDKALGGDMETSLQTLKKNLEA